MEIDSTSNLFNSFVILSLITVQAIEDVLLPQLQVYMPHLNNLMEDTSLTNALLKTDANKVYGAILVSQHFNIT